ncbi:MAG: hypothetical protein JXA90_02310, partial [Planctomycetes bacterium]|nr:hypothetical protein [Planctomycetota bacterium]
QLSRTESGLQALRQASAHQAAEAREAQRLQSEILERAGRDALRVARASAERFSRRILDMAGAFEREALTSGPLDELDDGAARPEDDRSFRWLPSAMARWWPARLRGSERLLRISRRLDDLESRLERRDAERARWSRALRETCEEELRLLAELSGEERDARREPDAEDTLLFAREIRSRRGAIPGEGGWRAREDRILEKAPHP